MVLIIFLSDGCRTDTKDRHVIQCNITIVIRPTLATAKWPQPTVSDGRQTDGRTRLRRTSNRFYVQQILRPTDNTFDIRPTDLRRIADVFTPVLPLFTPLKAVR